ncbi:MAG: DUF1553 domain-containing protein [Saprospiraceae bacterium]
MDFNFHVKPILSDRCFACHGPDEKSRKGNLRLDTEEGAFALIDSAENRYAIVAGDLKRSHLVDRIESQDPDWMMPPPESNLSLSSYEVDILKKWIRQGAEWKTHWAFIPPEKPALPTLKNQDWPNNEIDYYILAKLEDLRLQPNAPASKEKLLRRLYFDLTGLPPSLEEIDAFLQDTEPDAYERVVDRLLAQETYGERLAMEWMDLARYADSHGYQDDLERSMWPWRDWVIEAFNQNLPYDQFVSWQLAGDLLPDPTYEQKLATGFNRNHKITQEVGVIDEEYRVTYVLDRVNTFSTAFLGLTVECAQCHDHKYDPISQKEYYQLFSFFNNIPEKGRVEYNVEVAEPALELPEEKVTEIKDFVNNLLDNQRSKVYQASAKKWDAGFDAQKLSLNKSHPNNSLPKGLVAYYPFDHTEKQRLEDIAGGSVALGHNDLLPVPGKFSGALEFIGRNYAEVENVQAFNFQKPFSVSFWFQSLDGGISGPAFSAMSADHKATLIIQADGQKHLRFYLGSTKKRADISVRSKTTLPENEWVQVTMTYDGNRKAEGVKLYMNGELLDVYILNDKLSGSLPKVKHIYFGMNNPTNGSRGLLAGQIDEMQFYQRVLSQEEVLQVMNHHPLVALMAKKERSEAENKRLFYHQLLHNDPGFQNVTDRFRKYKIRQKRLEEIVLKPTMIMQEMDTVRPAYILERGLYNAPGERVYPGTPAEVLPFQEQYSANRLGLTEWLFAEDHPLTARVAVNRYWQMIFSQGLVATPGDFGSQGALPSHPELLDWLALYFRDSGWDLKALIKKIVSSATYQQAVDNRPKLLEIDPDNIYLARGPQARLPAEMVRDHALASSGLLQTKVGGPSVKPYQPEGLWLETASGNQSLRKYLQDHGSELYRRSLYSFWKRSVPPPSLTIFDAPSREQCTIQRQATSTPMQALVLLNDPQFVEASRLIGSRMWMEGGENLEDQIIFGFRLATSRKPKPAEIQELKTLFQEEKARFEQAPEAAAQLIKVGEYPLIQRISVTELAAYTVLANTILNLTESIQKG